jgi:hypothetical protein
VGLFRLGLGLGLDVAEPLLRPARDLGVQFKTALLELMALLAGFFLPLPQAGLTQFEVGMQVALKAVPEVPGQGVGQFKGGGAMRASD